MSEYSKPTMSLDVAAETMNIHPHTLEKKIRDGEIPAGKVGRSYVLLTADVLKHVRDLIDTQTAMRVRAKIAASPRRSRQQVPPSPKSLGQV